MQGYGTFSSIHFRFGAAEHLKIFCQGAQDLGLIDLSVMCVDLLE